MYRSDVLEDLLALMNVYKAKTGDKQSDKKPICLLCGSEMYYDKLELKWLCVVCLE